MVQHLALDDERFWFRAVMTGEQTVIDELAGIGNTWHVASDVPVADIFETYRQEIDRADAIINATPLDAKPAWWPDFFGDFRLDDMRDVMLHVIAETACHAGHLDVVRELIDGAAGWRPGDDSLPVFDKEWWESYRSRLERVARESGKG